MPTNCCAAYPTYQASIEGKLEKKRKNLLGAPAGKKVQRGTQLVACWLDGRDGGTEWVFETSGHRRLTAFVM